jgi:hypothetical protein
MTEAVQNRQFLYMTAFVMIAIAVGNSSPVGEQLKSALEDDS